MEEKNVLVSEGESASPAKDEAVLAFEKEEAMEMMRKRVNDEINSQLREISRLDETVKTVDDILAKPTGEKVKEYVKAGLTLLEAFKLANIDALIEGNREKRAREAFNLANSKSHLIASRQHGLGLDSVPRDEMEIYREFNPTATDNEIRRHYTTYRKGK